MTQPKVATIEEKKSKLNQKNILVIDDSITTRTLEKIFFQAQVSM